ncbi:MAG: ADP-dependent glucokinase/phosphofructokinase [Candidatus Aenigmatarchaeota archaeon]
MQTEEKLKRLEDLSIFLAYNTNVDVITHIDKGFASHFSKEEVVKAKEKNPKLLENKTDLLTAVLDCMEKGQGNEIQITSQRFKDWLEENLDVEEKRLGGQAGIMSNLLSKLGCDTVLYTTNLSEEQASLFDDNENLKFPCVEGGELNFNHPSECYKDIPTKKNWILEFLEDQDLFGVTTEENSRFIASSPYRHENLELGELEEKIGELAEYVDCMILAGYHNLLKEYPDGSTWREHLVSARKFIKEVKKRSPGTKIQIEFSAIHRKDLRKAILKEIVPLADVFSFDPNELALVQKDLEIEKKAPGVDSPSELVEVLKEILKKLDVDGVSIHAHHYFLSVSRGYMDPEAVKKGFEFARNAVRVRASGEELTEENLKESEDLDPSARGEELRRKLGENLGNEKFAESGVYRDDFDIVMVPNKIYENPELSVGLGDVVSATSFAMENAIR